jgi:Skp family chaperone for outer membrane proteins
MKKLIRAVVVPGFLLLLLSGSCAWGQTRIATVDLAKTFKRYWKTQQAEIALQERIADMDKELKNMVEDQKKTKEDYQNLLNEANDQARSPSEREKCKKSAEDKLKSLRDQEEGLNQYQSGARQRLADQRSRVQENLLGEIRSVVTAEAKSAGYALVLNSSGDAASGVPVVVFASSENDLTEKVIEQLNKAAPPDTTKAVEKKDGKKDDKNK